VGHIGRNLSKNVADRPSRPIGAPPPAKEGVYCGNPVRGKPGISFNAFW
jgi:hypothetical protein